MLFEVQLILLALDCSSEVVAATAASASAFSDCVCPTCTRTAAASSVVSLSKSAFLPRNAANSSSIFAFVSSAAASDAFNAAAACACFSDVLFQVRLTLLAFVSAHRWPPSPQHLLFPYPNLTVLLAASTPLSVFQCRPILQQGPLVWNPTPAALQPLLLRATPGFNAAWFSFKVICRRCNSADRSVSSPFSPRCSSTSFRSASS